MQVLATHRCPLLRCCSYYRTNEVDQFQYSRPFRKGEKDPDNEFAVSFGFVFLRTNTRPQFEVVWMLLLLLLLLLLSLLLLLLVLLLVLLLLLLLGKQSCLHFRHKQN